jgi:hypothetical protein
MPAKPPPSPFHPSPPHVRVADAVLSGARAGRRQVFVTGEGIYINGHGAVFYVNAADGTTGTLAANTNATDGCWCVGVTIACGDDRT